VQKNAVKADKGKNTAVPVQASYAVFIHGGANTMKSVSPATKNVGVESFSASSL